MEAGRGLRFEAQCSYNRRPAGWARGKTLARGGFCKTSVLLCGETGFSTTGITEEHRDGQHSQLALGDRAAVSNPEDGQV